MENKKEFIYVLLICAIAAIWFVLLFSQFQSAASGEWDWAFTQHEIQRKIILKYHQLPLWNPYLSGGEPCLAHPEADYLSPFSILILLFGTIRGTLAIYFLYALTGLLGIYFLSRYYRLERPLSLLNAVLFLNLFNMLARPGVFPFLLISFIPWAYLFFNKSKNDKNYVFYTAIILALIAISGSLYILFILLIVLFLDALISTVSDKKPGLMLNFSVTISLGLLLAAVRLIPLAELLKCYPRITALPPSGTFLNLDNLWNGMALFSNFLFSQDNTYNIYYLQHFADGNPGHYYFSIAIFVIFILSCIYLWKKYTALVVMNVVFALLFLGDYSPVNLWRLLHFFLPSLRGPHKFFVVLMMTFSLSTGLLIRELQIKLAYKKIFKSMVFLLLLVVTLNLFLSASREFAFNNGITPYLCLREELFSQTKGNPDRMFEVVYRNQGNLSNNDRSDIIGSQIRTMVMAREEAGYRGEYYLQNGFGQIEQVLFSPNKLVFKLKLNNDDRLVINQNYFPGWHGSVGEVKPLDGLLSVSLNKDDTKLRIYYLPVSFLVGLLVSLSSLGLIVYLMRRE